jgi:hypothetical protein
MISSRDLPNKGLRALCGQEIQAMTKKIERVDDDGNVCFSILVDGEHAYTCEREIIPGKNGSYTRGYWLLKKSIPGFGPVVLERDQYSNDILERVDIHENVKPIWGDRYRIECHTRAHYNVNVADWIEDLSKITGHSWNAEYDDVRNLVVFEKNPS